MSSIWAKLLGKHESSREDLDRERLEQRRKDDVRRRLQLLQSEVDVIKRNLR